jgi:lipopolysaccharide export system protein LptC
MTQKQAVIVLAVAVALGVGWYLITEPTSDEPDCGC